MVTTRSGRQAIPPALKLVGNGSQNVKKIQPTLKEIVSNPSKDWTCKQQSDAVLEAFKDQTMMFRILRKLAVKDGRLARILVEFARGHLCRYPDDLLEAHLESFAKVYKEELYDSDMDDDTDDEEDEETHPWAVAGDAMEREANTIDLTGDTLTSVIDLTC